LFAYLSAHELRKNSAKIRDIPGKSQGNNCAPVEQRLLRLNSNSGVVWRRIRAMEEEMNTHKGGCHCGRVRFEVRAPATINVSQCNCSICSKSGHLGMIVPRDRFTLVSGEDCLAEYRFGNGVARHLFCKNCGIKSFYYPRSHPEGVSVNASCIDPGTVEDMIIKPFDGQNWERYYPQGRADGYPN